MRKGWPPPGPPLLRISRRGDDPPDHVSRQFFVDFEFARELGCPAHDLGLLRRVEHRQPERLFGLSNLDDEVLPAADERYRLAIDRPDLHAQLLQALIAHWKKPFRWSWSCRGVIKLTAMSVGTCTMRPSTPSCISNGLSSGFK